MHKKKGFDSEYNNSNFMDPYQNESYAGHSIDLPYLLGVHLSRIMLLGTGGYKKQYSSAVLNLHQLLMPYHSKYYLEFLKKNISKNRTILFEASERYYEEPQKIEMIKAQLEEQLAFRMFGELCKLMTNIGLMPIKSINTEYVEKESINEIQIE